MIGSVVSSDTINLKILTKLLTIEKWTISMNIKTSFHLKITPMITMKMEMGQKSK